MILFFEAKSFNNPIILTGHRLSVPTFNYALVVSIIYMHVIGIYSLVNCMYVFVHSYYLYSEYWVNSTCIFGASRVDVSEFPRSGSASSKCKWHDHT